MNQQNIVQYDPLMHQQLVARFNVQGELLLETEHGESLELEKTLLLLQQQKRLNQVISVVWVPSQQVVLTEVKVPGKRRSYWIAALPFALEEGLSSPIENYHILALHRDKSEKVSAMVVDIELMQQWQATLAGYGLNKAILVADCFRIEWHTAEGKTSNPSNDDVNKQSTWLVCDNAYVASQPSPTTVAENYLVRTGEYLGLAANAAWFEVLKQQSAENANRSIKETSIDKTRLLNSSQKSLLKVKALSLSQGAFSADSSAVFNWFEWRWVGVLTVLLLVLVMAMQWQQTQTLQKQAAYTQEQTEILFKTLFPESKRIVNIKAQTLSNLKQANKTQNDAIALVPILNKLAPIMAQHPKVDLTELEWSTRKTEALQLKLKASASIELEKLHAQIQQALSGFKVRLSLNNVTNKVAEGVLYVAAN